MIRFIDKYRNRFLVEFICKTLKNNRAGGFITSRGYRQSKARGLSARRLRDGVLVERSSAVHRDNYGVFSVRKMWHALDRDGIDIGREQTARLMRLAGVSGTGTGTGGSPITARKANVPDLRPDVVEREFKAQGLKQAVGGRHYLCTDTKRIRLHRICHRRLLPEDRRVGVIRFDADFKLCRCKLSTKRFKCAEETTGLIHHSDHGSQYVSVVYNQRLTQHGITASTGTVGDSYDNALAENVNGSYKNELVHTRRWDDVVEVEIATFEWMSWWNETRLHQSLGYRTPAEVETELWKQNLPQAIMENNANA